jgi:hypothetical protein
MRVARSLMSESCLPDKNALEEYGRLDRGGPSSGLAMVSTVGSNLEDRPGARASPTCAEQKGLGSTSIANGTQRAFRSWSPNSP